jgi:hypothetical protein
MPMAWIIGAGSGARWHLGQERPYSYDPRRTYLATVCTGRQIGGAFGPSIFRGEGMPGELEHARCKRCEAIAQPK